MTGDLTIESLADEFRSDSHSTAVGLSLAAIGAMTQNVRPDAGFADPRLGAIPTMRFANQEDMSLRVRELAQLVRPGEVLSHRGRPAAQKSAVVGLKPDGVVVRNDAEKILSGRILDTKVRQAESHKRSVFNPCVGEFVAMMSQVDELQQIRAKIAEIQAVQGAPRAEREKTDREVKEFLDKPEVKEKLQKLKQTRQKQQRAVEKMRQLEAEDPTLPMRMVGMSLVKETPTASSAKTAPKATAKTATPSIKPTVQKASISNISSGVKKSSSTTSVSEKLIAHDELPAPTVSSVEMNRVFAWSRARQQNKSGGREAMEMLSSINESLDAFAVDHPNIAKVGAAIVEGIGYAAVGGTLLVAADGGLLPLTLTGSTMLASNEVVAAVLEHGAESLVKEAASLGTTEAEAVRFGTNMAGTINKLMFLGATKLAVKVVKGGKGTVKNLSTSEAAAVSKQSFREMQTNPMEFEASIAKGVSQAVGKNPLMKMEMERLADATNKAPYNPRLMESLLKARYGEDAVTSTTMPRSNAKNVGLAGMRHPETGIIFNERGLSVFDSVAVVEARISGKLSKMTPDAHKKAATAQLKADIEAGKVNRSLFNKTQLDDIWALDESITGYTWHHHEDVGRMQLVPREVHKSTGHIGGDALWGIPKGDKK